MPQEIKFIEIGANCTSIVAIPESRYNYLLKTEEESRELNQLIQDLRVGVGHLKDDKARYRALADTHEALVIWCTNNGWKYTPGEAYPPTWEHLIRFLEDGKNELLSLRSEMAEQVDAREGVQRMVNRYNELRLEYNELVDVLETPDKDADNILRLDGDANLEVSSPRKTVIYLPSDSEISIHTDGDVRIVVESIEEEGEE